MYFVSETAQVELRSGRVQAPAAYPRTIAPDDAASEVGRRLVRDAGAYTHPLLSST